MVREADLGKRDVAAISKVVRNAPEAVKREFLDGNITLTRAEEAVDTYTQITKGGGQVTDEDVQRHIVQIKQETKEDDLHQKVRLRVHRDVLGGRKESAGYSIERSEDEAFIDEIRKITDRVKTWGVPTMMVVGPKAWAQAREQFRAIRDHMDFLIGTSYQDIVTENQ